MDNKQLPLPAPISTGRRSSRRALWAFPLAVLFSVSCWAYFRHTDPAPHTPHHESPSYLITAERGAVASENIICSELGIDILKQGGNAVDAAISVALCVGVVNPFSSGIAGGGFMTVRIPPSAPGESSEVYNIDFRETGPALANASMFVGKPPNTSLIGGLSVGVPGELRGLAEAHRRWGTLPWSQLVQPAADIAAGWKMGAELARRIRWFPDLMLKNPDWTPIFAPNGQYINEGDMTHWTNYSRTLSAIAEEGPEAFYKGPIADSIIRKVQAEGGILTQDDLDGYKVKVTKALMGTHRGKKVYTTHAPTSGPVLLHLMNIMETYDLEGRTDLAAHRTVEAMKFGFAARTKICDPAFNNQTEIIAAIPTKEYAKKILANITDDYTHPPEYYKPEHDILTDHGTSHSSTVDQTGMAVALTSTINFLFGSQVLDPHTGIIMNDEMDDFSTPGVQNGFGLLPSPYNYPAPGKRPLSSITPTIIENEDGSLYLTIGGSGGSRIFPAVFQVILNLELGLQVDEAIEYGRMHDQLYPIGVDVDDIYPDGIVEGLKGRGHNVTVADVNRVAACVQAVFNKDGKIYAASDSRKRGIAAGW